jgi:HAE1 family hydrophobic/amphiphilic exporter-1
MWVSNTSIRQPVFATMVISALIVFGVVSYRALNIDLFPKVDFPIVTVTSVLPGADPETMETDVTERLEEALNTIGGVKTLRSTSSEGVSIVVIEFDSSARRSAAHVRDKSRRRAACSPRPAGAGDRRSTPTPRPSSPSPWRQPADPRDHDYAKTW